MKEEGGILREVKGVSEQGGGSKKTIEREGWREGKPTKTKYVWKCHRETCYFVS